jgi:hypothetical protein
MITQIFSENKTEIVENENETKRSKKRPARKLDLSEPVSNLLMFSSVVLALTPLFLGDKLPLIVADAMREGTTMLDQLVTFVTRLFS